MKAREFIGSSLLILLPFISLAGNQRAERAACVPVAKFVFQSSDKQVHFQDSTGNAQTWEWTFGDGQTSISQNPNHEYADSGTYQVCLKVTNSCGTDTYCHSVYVCAKPEVSFTFSGSAPTFQFTNLTQYSDSCMWIFGDGGRTTTYSPTYTYQFPGKYQVCLICQNPCGNRDTCLTIESTGLCSPESLTLNLYPNPNSSRAILQIESADLNYPLEIDILDVQGKLQRQYHSIVDTRLKIEKGNLVPGIYFVHVTDQAGMQGNLKMLIE
ncbi:MAG: PKD domain-containing protein [Bacteroidetes bacterium]|nr:PKD domain-containing protein [Bacteroidota bacterium]